MRLLLLRLSILPAFTFIFTQISTAQNSCISTNLNNTTVNLACNQVCQNLVFQIPHIKSSSDYAVNSVAFAPYSFTGGTAIPSIYIDDEFSGVIPITFPFCFYDSIYNNAVVGSNGVVTFQETCATLSNAYTLSSGGAPQPIPYNVGTAPGGIGTTYYPRASIMGAYHDINPADATSLPTRRIEYKVVGSAPCRKFVVSYLDVKMFNCPSLICSQQIVMHESTGIIEVFLVNKPVCASWPSSPAVAGLAILGVQNWARDKAVAAPGKNCTVWSESNTAYRFTPSGGASRFQSSKLFTMADVLVATADTSTVTPGLLNISFPNFCQPAGSTQYKLVTTYTACNNAATVLTSTDTITVSRLNGLNATATTTNATCGPPSGTITVTVPAGAGTAPYTFVLDGTVTQTGASPMVFNNVAYGNHTVVITDASGGCTSTLNPTVNLTNGLTATVTPAATSCPGVNNGTINVTPTNGVGPYTFVLNPGNITRTGATASFTGLAAGSYTIAINDAGGCGTVPALTTTVTAGSGLAVNATQTPTICAGGNSGTITVTPTTGTAPYTFVLNGTITQTGPTTTFTNVPAGNHSITITDAIGCTRAAPFPITVFAGPPLTASISHTNTLCNNSATGTITVSPPAPGTAPFEYSLNGTTWQSSNVFSGLAAGTYQVYFRESGGCFGILSETVGQPNSLTVAASSLPATCNGVVDGSITVVPSGGTPPYQYSINGGTNWQPSNTFIVAAGTHTVTIRDANQCSTTQMVTVTQPANMTASAITSNGTCNGGNDGTITLTANGGNVSYEYSLNGGNSYQPSNVFNVAPGTYTGVIRDALGCTVTVPNIIVDVTNDLTYAVPSIPTICEGSSTQLSINSNAVQYSWSPSTGLSSTTVSNPVVNPAVTTTYTVHLTFGLCSTDVPVTVNVNAAPIPDAGADAIICFGQTTQLQGAGGVQFSWTPSTYLDSTNVYNPVSTPNRSITYSLSVVDANGCPSLITDQVRVDVTPPIKVTTFPFDTIAYEGDKFQLLAISAATDYLWSPSTGLDNPNVPDPILTAGAIGDVTVYKVVASTQAGCKGEGFVRVQVYKGPELYVPTGFTPNGDGKNDKFFPFPVGIERINYFRVFNRWGQMLFSTSTLNDGWDGKFGGVNQATGVYVWVAEGITKDNRVITKKGTVTLVR